MSIFVETPFAKIATKSWNQQQDKKLLAVHGWMDNLASFEDLLPLLPEYHSVAMDLPGHGYSEHRAQNRGYAFGDWPLDVAACADALEWSKYSILGHSLGASIACFVAALCPQKVKTLFLVEGLGPITSENPIHTLRSHISENVAFCKKKPPIYRSLDGLIAKRSESLPLPAAKSIIERSVYSVPQGYKWRMDGRLRITSPVRLSENQVLEVLAMIECPVLLFKAVNGLSYDEGKIKKRCEVISHLEIIEIPGRHHAHMECPELIANHIRSFVS